MNQAAISAHILLPELMMKVRGGSCAWNYRCAPALDWAKWSCSYSRGTSYTGILKFYQIAEGENKVEKNL